MCFGNVLICFDVFADHLMCFDNVWMFLSIFLRVLMML